MARRDYIAETGETTRWLSIAALVPVTFVCAACFLVALAIAILDFQGAPLGPLLGCILIFGGLAFASCWMTVRLIRRKRATNGRTTMPEMFIQVFGVFFLIGLVFTAILNRNIWISVEAIGVAFAMITIRSIIRRAQVDSNSKIDNKLTTPDNNTLDRSR